VGTGVYYKIVGIDETGQLKAECTNPGVPATKRTIPPEDVRKQLHSDIVRGQLGQANGDHLSYVAKCYATERHSAENDDTLRARLASIAIGPS
jgi:hypothetical protein